MRSQSGSKATGGALTLDGGPLSIADVCDVARDRRPLQIGAEARRRLADSRKTLDLAIRTGEAIYGVNTGFGALSRQRIADDDLQSVQENLLRSHASGVGDPLPEEVVRGMLTLLAASLCRGCSGARPLLVEHLVALLNAGVTPIVPEIGSVGASGDLAPLAHAVLVLIGEGEATHHGKRLTGAEALQVAGVEPVKLGPKEGLAMINGTHLMAAQASLAMADIDRLFDAALCAAAMSIDACRATDAFLDDRVHVVRRQVGQREVAGRLRSLLRGSAITPSHIEDDPRVQDPYSLRCAPPVLGAALDIVNAVRVVVERELGAVTDNPLVLAPDDDAEGALQRLVVSAGNFHGMPLALHLDALAPALCHIAGIAERRVYFMLAARDPEAHLSPQLSPTPGLQSGLMITQYVAAACCNELIGLATPASVANLPTCAGMEDYNSFGPRSAAKARRGVELAGHVVAIELLCAAEALERHRPMKSGAGVEKAHALVRSVAPALERDRPPSPDIAAIERLIADGRFSEAFS